MSLAGDLLYAVLIILTGFSLLISLLLPLLDPQGYFLTSLALFLVTAGLLLWVRLRGLKAVFVSSVLLCVGMWFVVTWNSWSDGGIHNVATMTYFIVVTVAGLLLGPRGAVAFGVLTMLSALVLYRAEVTGLVVADPRSIAFVDAFKLALIIATMTVLVRFGVKRLGEALARAQASERALAERAEELEAANARLEVLSHAKDDFVANVSHELRSPLAGLMLAHEGLRQDPDRLDEYLPLMQREAGRLRALIEDLLGLSRFDRKRVAANLDEVDLLDLVREYAADRSALAASHGLDLSVEPAPVLPAARADAGLIGQVLSILLTNAFNYTPPGGRVVVSTQASEMDRAGWVGFAVRDTGPGVLPDEKRLLFTRFYRGQAGLSSGVEGTGLGLAIAHEIVDLHGGRIEVESDGQPGRGATFRVWLPAA